MVSLQLIAFIFFTTVSLTYGCTSTTTTASPMTTPAVTTTAAPTTSTTVAPATTPLPACVRGCPRNPATTAFVGVDATGMLLVETLGTLIPCEAADAAEFAAEGQTAQIRCTSAAENDLRYRISASGNVINTQNPAGTPGGDQTFLPIRCGPKGWLVAEVTLVDAFGCE